MGGLISTPADRVTTLVYSSLRSESTGGGVDEVDGEASDDNPYAGMGGLAIAQSIYEEKGIMGFLEGGLQRSIYWFFGIAIFLGVYCTLRRSALDLMQ